MSLYTQEDRYWSIGCMLIGIPAMLAGFILAYHHDDSSMMIAVTVVLLLILITCIPVLRRSRNAG